MNENNKELFGYGYNFQSGFGNLNDTADSIGSMFGFGPEDREAVLQKADKITRDFFQTILALCNSGQYDQAIQKLDAYILKNQNLAKRYKSSNSKAKHNKIANDLITLKATLKNKTSSSTVYDSVLDSVKSTASGVETKKASLGYIALGIMALYLFSKKGKSQMKMLNY